MMDMTVIFIYLLGTTRLQDLTASMVQQMKIPYEYAFMFTAGLRFVPDFIEENRAVAEAQACRGLSMEGNFLKKSTATCPSCGRSCCGPSAGARPWRSLWNCADSAAKKDVHGQRGAEDGGLPFMAVIAAVTAGVIAGRILLGL